jgi:hypothetical protein
LRSSQANQGLGFFVSWYNALLKNKTGAAALPLVGMSVAFFIMETSRLTPQIVSDSVAWLGFDMLAANVFLFFIASALYVIIGLRQAYHQSGRRKPPASG